MSFIRGFNPVWSFVDLTGHQFDDTYYMFVLENTLPYLPTQVYHTPNGTPWDNPIQFLANGTLPVDIFWDAGSESNPRVYRLEFRRGNTQDDPLIYEINNYIPGDEGGTAPSDIGFITDNQITNAQFSLVNFNGSMSLSSSFSLDFEVAPGWNLELISSGATGTATITQTPLNDSIATPSNAPYALRLNLTGWTSAILKQRFNVNGVLWANKVISGAVTARLQGIPQNISSILVDSNGTTIGTILDGVLINGEFNERTGHATLPESTNPDLPPNAYIEYQILLPGNIDIFLTSFQLIAGNLEIEYSYEQDSVERQIDHTFHYFKPQLEAKPISSYLTGWDFPSNPAQFLGGSTRSLGAIGANKGAYLWDQTIGFQTTNNSVSASRTSLENMLITVTGTGQFAIIQYLDAVQARQLLLNRLSVMTRLAGTVPVACTVSLWYTTGALPNLTAGTNETLINTLDSNGHPSSVKALWNELPRDNFQRAVFTTPTDINDALVGFNGWSPLPASTVGSVTFFAIVVGFGSLTNQSVQFSSISLVPGDIPTIPAPQDRDQVLEQCEFYFESSYNSGSAINTPTNIGALAVPQSCFWLTGSNQASSHATPFSVNFRTRKRASPNVTLISTSGVQGNVRSHLFYFFGSFQDNNVDASVATNWGSGVSSLKNINYLPITLTAMNVQTTSAGVASIAAGIYFHYLADSRLGLF